VPHPRQARVSLIAAPLPLADLLLASLLTAGLLLAGLLAAPAVAQDAATATDDAAARDDAATQDDAATRQFDFANGLYLRGKAFYGQAAEQYRIFLRDYPADERCDEALFRLGECYRKDGKLADALKTFDEHARRFGAGKNADRAALRRGQVLDALGKHADAIAAFRTIMQGSAAPEFKQAAQYRVAKALLDAGQADEAIKLYTAIADTDGDRFRPYAIYQLGVAHLERGAPDEAVKRFNQLAGLSAEFAPEALFRVGEIEFKRDRYAEAAAAYRQVADKHAESTYAGAAAYGLVQSLARAKQYKEAIAAYDKYKALVPKPVQPQTAYLVANAHYELGRYDVAFKFYEQTARDAPKTELALKAEFKMAWCRYFLKQFDTLAKTGTAFLNEHPRFPDADKVHYLVAEAFLQLQRPQDALLHYETIVKDYADSPVAVEAEYKLGWCLFQKGEYDPARTRFLGFADKRRDDRRAAEAVARAAECSIKLVKMQDAVADYQRLLSDYPQDALAEGALFQLGLAYLSLDDQDNAVATFLDFVKRYPESRYAPDARYWIGSQKQKAGEQDEAIAYLKKAVETGTEPRFIERAKYKLATIYHENKEFDTAADIWLDMLKKNEKADVPDSTHLWTAGYLLGQQRFADAKLLYEAFFKKFSGAAVAKESCEEAHFGLGECLRHEKKWEPALGQYNKAIAFKGPLKLRAELYAAECLLKLGKEDEAVALLTELVKTEEPTIESSALYWLGTVDISRAKKEKDAAKAAELFDAANKRFLRVVILYGNADERPECMFRAAECHEALGNPDEAAKQFRELIEEYPESPFTKEARKRLDESKENTTPGG